jgi:hypothetical protein
MLEIHCSDWMRSGDKNLQIPADVFSTGMELHHWSVKKFQMRVLSDPRNKDILIELDIYRII